MKLIQNTDTVTIIESQRHMTIFSILLIVSALGLIIFGISLNTLALIALGLFFGCGGVFMAWIAETQTTLLQSNGTITITYSRIIGSKKWVRRFNRSHVLKIDYVKGRNVGDGWMMSTIYLDTSFGQQISIGSQLRTSIDTQVNEIAAFLQAPINNISMLSAKSSIENLYVPKDSMKPILQRPSQKQLDEEPGAITY